MEEKTLLPLARHLQGGRPLEEARQLKLDHSALAALLVPTPTPAIVATLRRVLEAHNALEEGPHGVYARCEALAGPSLEHLAAELRRTPPVKLAPYNDAPRAFESIERQLKAAGRA
jgi:hypothetical protein